MKRIILLSLSLLLGTFSIGFAQNANILTIHKDQNNEITITIDPQIHNDYGVTYPLTYEFSIPEDKTDLVAYKKYSNSEPWEQLPIKTSDEFYNAWEMVRFEYTLNKIFLSAGFFGSTDSLFVKITDNVGQNIPISFNQICKYYDNRDAAVICSADDYADWNRANFLITMQNFRNLHLWLSIGANTASCSAESFDLLQDELNAGYIEASAHGRTHAWGPYDDPIYEIIGCKEDLINFLNIPFLFRSGDREYVYLWIAPYGYNDETVDSLLGQHKFLANRLYYDGTDDFPEWDDQYGLYQPFGVTRELGPVREFFIGTGDSTDLNNAFDEVISKGGVYHLMCHPSIIEWDEDYTWNHLNHISNLKNIWYSCVGHAFVYHFAQENYQYTTTSVSDNESLVLKDFSLDQNYPNPFNHKTLISYHLPVKTKVELSIYNSSGQKVVTTVSGYQSAGNYEVEVDARGMASGIYIYILKVNEKLVRIRKFILLK